MNFLELLPTLLAHVFIFCQNTNYSNAKSGKETWKVFSDENAIRFNHLTVHENGKWVYIGAADRIYQLSTDLELQINYTISELSPSDCTAPNCLHKLKRNTTKPYRDEVLVLDYQNQQMISCSIFFEGVCHAHDITNISTIWTTWIEPIAETDRYSRWQIVAFVATSISKNSSTPLSTLYVAVSVIGTRDLIEIIAIKNLEREYFSPDLTQNTAFNIARNECDIRKSTGVIHGFSSENVNYFITGSYALTYLEAGYLITTDANKNISCNTVPIICIPDSEVKHTGRILYVYIQTRNPDSVLKTDSHEIEKKIMFTLQIEQLHNKTEAFSVCRYQIDNVQIHSLIQKDEPLIGDLIFSHPPSKELVTAMAVTSINNYTILFLGTNEGRLQKISIRGFDSPDLYTGNKYADICEIIHTTSTYLSTHNE